MKLLLVCLFLLGCKVSQVSASEQTQLMKHLLRGLENEREDNVKHEKRYFYEDSNHKSPSVDPATPGKVWVDIRIDEAVIARCQDSCRVFIYYQCVSDECSNKELQRLPIHGYTWSEYREKFVTPTDHPGVWIDGLESGMRYEIWDGDIESNLYPGSERRSIVIP